MQYRGRDESSGGEAEKSPFQQGETRNPTTSKKIGLSPTQFRRTEPFQLGSGERKVSGNGYKRYRSLHMERSSLQMKRDRFIDAEEYSQAEKVDRQIRQSLQRMQRKKTRLVEKTQEQQRRSMNIKFKREVQHFEGVWEKYFEQFNKRQLRKMIGFKEKQQRLLQETRARLNMRCRLMRTNNSELIALEQRKKYFQQRGDLHELKLIKQEKNKAIAKAAKERQQMIAVYTQLEQQNFSRLQLNKYQHFVRKLEEARCDLTRYYEHEKARLQQKHANALSSLEHIQKMSVRRRSHTNNYSQ